MIDVKTKFITVDIFTLEPTDFPEFAREATLCMQRQAPSRPGFIEGIVMADESQRQALIVTQWESRSSWVGSEWDEEIGQTVANLVKGAKAFDFRAYEPITIVHA
jgi:heme-degrading monooxygenase HmoA